MKILPIVDFSRELNKASAEIETLERRINRMAEVISVYNGQIHEMLGVACAVTEIRLEKVKEYNQIPLERRKDYDFDAEFEKALRRLFDEYMKESEQLKNSRETLIEIEGATLTRDKLKELYDTVEACLKESIQKFKNEFPIDENTDTAQLQLNIEDVLEMREQVFEEFLDKKIEIADDKKTLEPILGSLIEKRKELKEGRTKKIDSIFQGIQQGDLNWIKHGLFTRSDWERKKFVNQKYQLEPQHQPAHMAAYFDLDVILAILINVGADLKGRDQYGYQPLHCSPSLRDDEGIVRVAALLDPSLIEYASERLQHSLTS